MPKSSPEQVVDFLLNFLPSLLPKSAESVAKSAIESFRSLLNGVLKEPRIQQELLEAAQKAEGEFRRQARIQLKNDDLAQAVASFPLFDRDLFQSTLAELPNHLREEYLAQDLQSFINNDWKGKFSPEELRKGVALYLNCLRVELLKVEGFADVVTRLATLRTDQRTEQILAIVTELSQLAKLLVDRGNVLPQITTTYGLFTIPQPVADFTGREQELEQLKESFLRGTIITGVSGAGGIGKTELARKLAHDIAGNYPDAQISIDLQGVSQKPLSSEEAMRRLLVPFGYRLPDDVSHLEGLYKQTFGKKKALLLLDNAENAAQVRSLIPSAPSAAIVTSRRHFSLTEFGMNEPIRLDVLSIEKTHKFLCAASQKLQNSSDEEINKIGKLCGYYPLALRVTVSLLNDRPDWVASHLISRLANERTRLQRLKRKEDESLNVEAVLSLSYDLLDKFTKLRFRQLSLFSESFDLDDISALWGKMEVATKVYKNIPLNSKMVDAVLEKLIASSLVEFNQRLGRYYLHDIIKLFAAGQLDFQEKTMAAWCLLDYYTRSDERKIDLEIDSFIQSPSLVKDYFYNLENLKSTLSSVRNLKLHEASDFELLKISGEHLVKYLEEVPMNLINRVDLFPKSGEEKLPAYKLALDLSIANRNTKYEALALERIGTSYYQLKDYKNALLHYEKSILLGKSNNDLVLEARNYLMMGLVYMDCVENNIETLRFAVFAYKCFRKAEKVFDGVNGVNGKIVTLFNLWKLLYSVGEDERCLKVLDQLSDSGLHPSFVVLLKAFVKKERLENEYVQRLVDDVRGLHKPKDLKPQQIAPGFYFVPSEKQRPRFIYDEVMRKYTLTSENGLDSSTNDFIDLLAKILVSGNFPK